MRPVAVSEVIARLYRTAPENPGATRAELTKPTDVCGEDELAAALDFAIETGAVVEFGHHVPPRYAVDEQERAYERAIDELVMTAILERAEKEFSHE